MTVFDSQSFGRRINELLLLKELDRTPLHGYQIMQEIEARSAGYFQFSHGTLYPLLHRLEKEGMISGTWSEPVGRRLRKEYTLTEAGRTYLRTVFNNWRELSTRLEPFIGGKEAGEKFDSTLRSYRKARPSRRVRAELLL